MTSLFLESLASVRPCLLLLGSSWCTAGMSWDEFSITLLNTVCCNLSCVDTEKVVLLYK